MSVFSASCCLLRRAVCARPSSCCAAPVAPALAARRSHQRVPSSIRQPLRHVAAAATLPRGFLLARVPATVWRAAPPRMYGTDAAGGPELDFDTAKLILQATIDQLDNDRMTYAQTMKMIKDNAGDFSLIMRWQAMVQVLLTVQLHNIVPYGWSPDDSGLKAFTMSLAAVCQNDPNGQELQELTKKRWQIVVDRSFGVRFRDEDRIPLERARQISSIMGLKMQSEAFLTTVDAAIAALGDAPSQEQRQAALLEVLFPLHLAMAEEFGFPGDEGYIRLQANLNEYSTDDSVNYNTMSGTMAVFRRAGISF